ncbi:uncharacterized protein [Henckelia pumila]|uniref:uncharacterized protein n=1 Tax=Henckelia pumila TaxID=405737 RepID=UPI003C6DFE75
MNNSSNEGSSDNSALAFGIIGGVSALAILLCCISACRRMERRADAPAGGSQTLQVAPAAVNGSGTAEKDGDLVIDVSEPAVAVIDFAIQIDDGGGGACCCGGGGGCGDGGGGGCGGCGGGD